MRRDSLFVVDWQVILQLELETFFVVFDVCLVAYKSSCILFKCAVKLADVFG